MLHRAALAAFVLLLAALTLCALALTAQNGVGDNRMLQVVTLARQPFLKSLSLSLCMLAALAGIHVLLEKIGGVRLNAGLCALWLAAAVFWIWAIGMRQRADAQLVMADASQFARGYYGALSEDYLQVYTYQLGLCLPLHVLAKLLSGPALGQLDFAAQCLNAALGIAGAGVLAALAQEIFEKRAALAALLLYIVSLPTLLFAQFVYNINLMILLCAGTMLCFARYVRTGRVGFGAGYALLGGLALAAKPNAAVVLLLFICALMHGWARKDGKIVLFAALSFAIGKGALAAVTAWYAQKGGVTFRANVSMWARLAMGMQESPIAAGWYNNYTERFFSADVTAEQEKAQALADEGEPGGSAGVLSGEAADPVARTGLRHAVVWSAERKGRTLHRRDSRDLRRAGRAARLDGRIHGHDADGGLCAGGGGVVQAGRRRGTADLQREKMGAKARGMRPHFT